MCRWIAYSGKPIFIDELVTQPVHSLVEQSLNTKLNLTEDGSIWSTNGDGFGVGWYSKKEEPGLFKDAMPAWNDENLHEICSQTKAHIFFSHIRASTNGAVQRNNSHPFKYKNWIFQHNGDIDNFPAIKRNVQFEIDPELFTKIQGTTDSETFFYLALTYGLLSDPKAALEKTIVKLEEVQENAGFEASINLSCSISDGKKLYTIRYGSGNKPVKSQFYSTDMTCIEDLSASCAAIPKGGVIVVSEPLDRHSDKWIEIPENSFLEVIDGQVSLQKLRFNR
jgi:predicted glutamine amidotransferase